MTEKVLIPKLEIQVKRGDDVSIPCTNFSITLSGYNFTGDIRSEQDVKLADLTFTGGSNSVTISVSNTTTTLMTDRYYYSYCTWTDTNSKKYTFLKIIWEMV